MTSLERRRTTGAGPLTTRYDEALVFAAAGEGPAVLAAIGERFGTGRRRDRGSLQRQPEHPRQEAAAAGAQAAHVASMATEPPDVLLVTGCDKIHNGSRIAADVATYGPDFWTTFGPSRGQLHRYYGAVSAAITERLPGSTVAAALARTVADLQSA